MPPRHLSVVIRRGSCGMCVKDKVVVCRGDWLILFPKYLYIGFVSGLYNKLMVLHVA